MSWFLTHILIPYLVGLLLTYWISHYFSTESDFARGANCFGRAIFWPVYSVYCLCIWLPNGIADWMHAQGESARRVKKERAAEAEALLKETERLRKEEEREMAHIMLEARDELEEIFRKELPLPEEIDGTTTVSQEREPAARKRARRRSTGAG